MDVELSLGGWFLFSDESDKEMEKHSDTAWS